MKRKEDQLERFEAHLEAAGERAGIAWLNSQSVFRFTAVIHYADGRGHPLHFYDRENPEVIETEELDQRATYCNQVIKLREPFHTEDSTRDLRLVGHPVRHRMRAYLGAPIVATDGPVQAVLCSFDPDPQNLEAMRVELFVRAAEILAPRLAIPPHAPHSRETTSRTETFGNWTLRVVERTKPGWTAPKYTIERSRRRADGSSSLRLKYGQDGFDSIDEALAFGREWCAALGDE